MDLNNKVAGASADAVAQAAVTHLTSCSGWVIPIDGGKPVG